jgi:hypothetical protein
VRSFVLVAGMLFVVAATGCDTAMNVTNTPLNYTPTRFCLTPPPKPFGGVSNDFEMIFDRRGLAGPPVSEALLTALFTLDLPLSLAADCVTFPLVVCHVFDKDPLARFDPAEVLRVREEAAQAALAAEAASASSAPPNASTSAEVLIPPTRESAPPDHP